MKQFTTPTLRSVGVVMYALFKGQVLTDIIAGYFDFYFIEESQ